MDQALVIDNYLPLEEHKLIYDYFMGNLDKGDIAHSCVWIYNNGISLPNDGHFQLVQQIFTSHTVISPAFNILNPIVKREEMTAIIRIKANMLLRTDERLVFDWAFHADVTDTPATTAIYYINTNDGYTLFEDGTKIESVSNRFVKFPCHLKHTGTTCTDTDRRILLNFNYYETI